MCGLSLLVGRPSPRSGVRSIRCIKHVEQTFLAEINYLLVWVLPLTQI